MAWVEQVGRGSWRVRYRTGGSGCGSVSGFATRTAAAAYVQDLNTDRRRGTWLDPAGAKMPLAKWVATWINTIDVETRTEENYRRCLRLHILPRWGDLPLGGCHRVGGGGVVEAAAAAVGGVHRGHDAHDPVRDPGRRRG